MTEAEWLTSSDPTAMLGLLRGKVTERQLWSFAIACFRHVWLEVEESVQNAVEIAEQLIANSVHGSTMRIRCREIDTFESGDAWSTSLIAIDYCQDAASPSAITVGLAQARLVREIIGNPFRPVAVDRAWLTEVVVGLAEGIYADQTFERMPILADALQDAGCTHEAVLNHCREPGVHVRGCWVVDLLTGRK